MRRRPRPRRGLHGRPAPVAAFPSSFPLHHNTSGGRNGWTGRQKGSNTRLPTLCAAPSASGRPTYAASRQMAPGRTSATARQAASTSADYDGRAGTKTAQKRAAMARMHSPRNGTGPAAIAAQIGRKMSYIIPIENYITSPSPYVRRDRRWSWLLPSLHPCPHRSGAIRSQSVTVPAD